MATNTAYYKQALTGGATNALDGINGTSLKNLDIAYVMVSNVLYVYQLDSTSGAAESSPDVIAPGTNPGDKRWILQDTVIGATGSGAPVRAGAPTLTGQATIPTVNLTGGQIAFPATAVPSADANTLDDYEEGTWTATYDDKTDTGNYTKIGKLVYVNVILDEVPSNPFGIVTGLPFSVYGANADRTPGNIGRALGCSPNAGNMIFIAKESQFTFYNLSGATQNVTLSGTARLDLSVTYND